MEQEQTLKILMLEDNNDDAELIVRTLKKEKFSFQYQRVETRDEFNDAFNTLAPDIVLSDHGLPGFNSLDALKICLREKNPTPFILVAGALSDDLVDCLREGAADYVLKSNLAKLPRAIRKVVEKKQKEENRLLTKIVSTMKVTWRKLVVLLWKPPSTFKINEAVQHVSGGPLMVVSGFTYHNSDAPHIICNWYDREQRVTLSKEYPEHELKHFDWNNPDKD